MNHIQSATAPQRMMVDDSLVQDGNRPENSVLVRDDPTAVFLVLEHFDAKKSGRERLMKIGTTIEKGSSSGHICTKSKEEFQQTLFGNRKSNNCSSFTM